MILCSLQKYIPFGLILFILFRSDYCQEGCITHSFPDFSYPNAKTLNNGYQIFVSAEGIYSLNPSLTNIIYSYNFTESQKFSLDLDKMKNSINQVEISQFLKGEGNELVIVYANNFVYILNEFGQYKFSAELDNKIDTEYSITLVAYKFDNGIYYFIIAHNEDSYSLFYYYSIILNENRIHLENTKNISFPEGYSLILPCISCQAMISPSVGKKLICFYNYKYSDQYFLIAVLFSPENQFSRLNQSNEIIEPENKEVKFIKSSINNIGTKSLVCYSVESVDKIKCLNYDITKEQNYQLNEVFFNVTYCSPKHYGFKVFFFNGPQEYTVSCTHTDKQKFSVHRFDFKFQSNH